MLEHAALTVDHEHDPIDAAKDEAPRVVVGDLPRYRAEMQPDVVAPVRTEMHREQVEEQRALALGVERQQLAAQVRPAALVDVPKVRRLTAQAGAVVDDLEMDLASSVLNDGHEKWVPKHTAAWRPVRLTFVLALALAQAACSSSSSSGDAAAATGTGGAAGSTGGGGSAAAGAAGSAGATGTGLGDYDPTPIGGARPTKVYEPTSYQKGTPMPVVILLHGFGASGGLQEALFQIKPQAEARGFLYAHPDGTVGADSKRFWNATDACCDFGNTKVDDVAYLSGLVTEISSRWTVDPKRVYFMGHSNGGFMSFRMACDRADMIAGIVSLAGAMTSDLSKCQPSAPVSVLHIHGTADDMVAFQGATSMGVTTPSAATSIGDWATFDGCGATPMALANRDVDTQLAGDETSVSDWTGCKANTDVQLWTIAGGGHIPNITSTFAADVTGFLLSHPKP